MYCEVYLFDAPYHIDRPFDYLCDDDLRAGDIVRVPFGRSNNLRLAVVTKVKDTCEGEGIKAVRSCIDRRFSLSEEMLGLCHFIKGYTLCSFGEAARCLIPSSALSEVPNVRVKKTCVLSVSPEEAETILAAKGRAGIRSEGQRLIVKYLMEIGSADIELIRAMPGVSYNNISALAERGLIKIVQSESLRNPYAEYARIRDRSEIVLSAAQQTAYNTIETDLMADEARAALLFGVTGSGKTKVIMKAIDKTLSEGRRVIMLVPEIALTPQTVNIFCRRYGERVAVIHSSLSQGERFDAWRRIKRGEVDLVIGTRSAIFAPLDNIGMIVIDEEHEHTYKSESDPKYHARDIAKFRCVKNDAFLLLSSATPSIESYKNAIDGKYTFVKLTERFGKAVLPEVKTVDIYDSKSIISNELYSEIETVLEDKKQAILLMNRRGFNTFATCESCKTVVTCPNCSISLTYHNANNRLMCHYCGFSMNFTDTCPTCNNKTIKYAGFGTQRIEDDIENIFPNAKVLRMDADTTLAKYSYEDKLKAFSNGEYDILLGTQMVAKGLNFPNLQLVGVILADTGLHLPDFRAAERTFSLITQVAGRAGRFFPDGKVFIQTYNPLREPIAFAWSGRIDAFYNYELKQRKLLDFPPFSRLIRLVFRSSSQRNALETAYSACDIMRQLNIPDVEIIGPAECPIVKISQNFRYQVILRSQSIIQIQKAAYKLL